MKIIASYSRLAGFLALMFVGIFFLSSYSSTPPADISKDILKQVNKLRKEKGLPELIMNDELNKIAEKHSEDMAKGRRAFGHAGFSQRSSQAAKKMKFSSIAENVAYGASTAVDVVMMWKQSPGHRKNMLGDYRYTGIGVSENKTGTLYYTQLFVK